MSISNKAIIHQSAIIEDGAFVDDGVYVGPYSCIGPKVVLKKGVRIESHVVISGDTMIDENSHVYPFSSLGLEPQDLKYKHEPSKLEIGKNTTIRENVTASLGTEGGGMLTKIGDNCLIMAYCHVAHDCVIGDNVILVNGVNLAGHVVVEDNVIIGGMSVVKQFIRIGKNAMIGGFTGVDRDITPYGLATSSRTTTLKGINIVGLKRKGFKADYISDILHAFNEIFCEENQSVLNERAESVMVKYPNNEAIQDIAKFIESESKNPICTKAIQKD